MPEKRTQEDFIEKCKDMHGEKYDLSQVEYIGTDNKVKVICRIHGAWFPRARSFMKGKGCKKCGHCEGTKKRTKLRERYIEECKRMYGDKYILDNIVYKNGYDKVKPVCKIHGEWETQANSFRSGHGCPSCNESKGEKLIAKILDENGVIYEREKRYKECRNKRPLPFDFYIPSINTLIEFDGEQHFHPWHDGDAKRLEETQKRDTIKTNYCLSRGIPLVRVSYTTSEVAIRNLILSLFV